MLEHRRVSRTVTLEGGLAAQIQLDPESLYEAIGGRKKSKIENRLQNTNHVKPGAELAFGFVTTWHHQSSKAPVWSKASCMRRKMHLVSIVSR